MERAFRDDMRDFYQHYEVGRKVIPPTGNIRLFGRDAYLDTTLGGVEVTFCETLEGLEARVEGQCVALLRGYRDMRQLSSWQWSQLPPVLYFEIQAKVICPRIAVA